MYKKMWLIVTTIALVLTGTISPAVAATGKIDAVSFCEGTVTTTFTATGVTDDGAGVDWVAIMLVGDTDGDGSVEPIHRKDYYIPLGATRAFTDVQTFTNFYPTKATVWLYDLTGPSSGTTLDFASLPIDVSTCNCSTRITFGSVDPAPINGYVAFFTGFLDNAFWPGVVEQGRLPAIKGEEVSGAVVVGCNTHVRAWLFNTTGSVIGYIPSQYEDGDGTFLSRTEDYGTGKGGEPIYVGRFYDLFVVGNPGVELPAGPPPEIQKSDTERTSVTLTGGELRKFELNDDLIEWGYWTIAEGYTLLGWSKIEADGTVRYAVPPNGPLTKEQLRVFIEEG